MIHQRNRNYYSVVVFILLTVLLFSCTEKQPAPFRGKNVLLISIDTCRIDYVEPYGGKKIKTPTLKAIAQAGLRFEDAVTPVPMTLPSHTTLLTGLHPIRHGVRDNFNGVLSETADTLPELFRESGYTTAGVIGAILLSRRTGLSHGFDFYNDEFNPQDYQAVQATVERKGERVTAIAREWLQRWISTEPRKSFFLFVHYYDPHMLYQPPQPYWDRYPLDHYGGEIAYVDTCIGELLDFLKANQLYEELLLMVVGDHGEGRGDHQEETHGLFLYEDTVRVPFLVKLPQSYKRETGQTITQSAGLEDLTPTLIELCGLSMIDSDGISLAPWLLGNAKPKERWTYLETQYPLTYNWSPIYALRNPEWKYIHTPKEELYNLRMDPQETNNLIQSATAQKDTMDQVLGNRLVVLAGRAHFSTKTTVTTERAEALASLGYTGGGTGRSAIGPSVTLPDAKDKIQIYNTIDKGLVAYMNGYYDKAIELFKTAIEEDPDNPSPYANLGLSYAQLQQWEHAIPYLAKSVLLSPDNLILQLQLAKTLMLKGDLKKARNIFTALIHQQPKLAEAYYNLGKIELLENHLPAALEQFQQAQIWMPDMPGIEEAMEMAKAGQKK